MFKHFPIHFLVKHERLSDIVDFLDKKKLLDFKKHFTKEMLMAFKNLLKITIDDLPLCIAPVNPKREVRSRENSLS